MRDLSPEDRRALGNLGVRIGRRQVFLQSLLDPQAVRLRGLLWSVFRGIPGVPTLDARASAPADPRVPREAYAACGYEVLGPRVVRVDRLEQILATAHRRARRGPFRADEEMGSLLGGGTEALAEVLRAAGFRRNAQGAFELPARRAAQAGSRR